MDIAKKLTEKARAAGQVQESSFFSVVDKKMVDAGGGNMIEVEIPNGQHRVRILSEKIGKGKSFNGQEQDQLQMTILDNGKQKSWNIPVKNDDGTLYYLVEQLSEIEPDEEFIVEAKKLKTGKYSKKIMRIGGVKADDVPSIQLDEELPPLGDEIKPEEIPF